MKIPFDEIIKAAIPILKTIAKALTSKSQPWGVLLGAGDRMLTDLTGKQPFTDKHIRDIARGLAKLGGNWVSLAGGVVKGRDSTGALEKVSVSLRALKDLSAFGPDADFHLEQWAKAIEKAADALSEAGAEAYSVADKMINK